MYRKAIIFGATIFFCLNVHSFSFSMEGDDFFIAKKETPRAIEYVLKKRKKKRANKIQNQAGIHLQDYRVVRTSGLFTIVERIPLQAKL